MLSLVVVGGLLVALAIPSFALETKNTGPADLPQGFASLQAYNRTQDAFPGDGNPAVIVVEAENVRAAAVQQGIAQLESEAIATGEFNAPVDRRYSTDDKLVQVNIPMAGDGFNEESKHALETLRGEVIPATIAAVPGATANVTGNTAGNEDFTASLAAHLPYVFAFVLGFAFLLLLYTFRSIVIPIKAIVLNLLSVGAAYGLLVLVFQKGIGVELIGGQQVDGIASWLPLFLFVVLFGLSMDYHVFILSRVREGYERGLSTEDAVSYGVKSTAGVVTNAAFVMVAVFAIFMTLSMSEFKQMGLGLAAAILIDATLVRAVLLPASMKLLGDWNWYLPSFLDWLPQSRRHESLEEQDGVRPEAAAA